MQNVKIISCFFSFPNFYTRQTRKKSHHHPLYDILITSQVYQLTLLYILWILVYPRPVDNNLKQDSLNLQYFGKIFMAMNNIHLQT